MTTPMFHPLVPGARLTDDWHNGVVPANIEVGENCVIDSSYCFKQYRPRGRIGLRIGRDVTIWRAQLAVEPEALLEIGDECHLANPMLVCAERITIGDGVYLGIGVTVIDSDFHPLTPAARLADTVALSSMGDRSRRPVVETRPVSIGNDVWVGHHATILKGVSIGEGAVIQPGALISRDVPAGAVMSGNPARPVQAEGAA